MITYQEEKKKTFLFERSLGDQYNSLLKIGSQKVIVLFFV